MSEREQVKHIIDSLPDYKINALLIFLRGITFDDADDDLFCERLVEEYLNNPDSQKHDYHSVR